MYFKEFSELAPSPAQPDAGYKVFFVIGITKGSLKLGALGVTNGKYVVHKKLPVVLPNRWGYWDPFQAFVQYGSSYLQVFFRSIPEVVVNQICSAHKLPQVGSTLTREICGFATDWVRNLIVTMVTQSDIRTGLGQRLALVEFMKETFPGDYLIRTHLPPLVGGLYTTVSSTEPFNPTGTPAFLSAFDDLFSAGEDSVAATELIPVINFPRVHLDVCEGGCETTGLVYDLTHKIISHIRKIYSENTSGKVIPFLTILTALITSREYSALHPEQPARKCLHGTGNKHFDSVLGYVVQMLYLGDVRVCYT
ncbi:ORF41 [Silurid herpesvirus 1]|nr:ORF41 [Silurid herpesvirus 1]